MSNIGYFKERKTERKIERKIERKKKERERKKEIVLGEEKDVKKRDVERTKTNLGSVNK